MARFSIAAALTLIPLLGCGHYDFERTTQQDGAVSVQDGALDAPVDAPEDPAGVCPWSIDCQVGQLTCCGATGASCVAEDADCPGGRISGCSLAPPYSGCAPGSFCCADTDGIPRCVVDDGMSQTC